MLMSIVTILMFDCGSLCSPVLTYGLSLGVGLRQKGFNRVKFGSRSKFQFHVVMQLAILFDCVSVRVNECVCSCVVFVCQGNDVISS